MLRDRSPLEPKLPFDLHTLGTPLAFVLSQDQTLHENHPPPLSPASEEPESKEPVIRVPHTVRKGFNFATPGRTNLPCASHFPLFSFQGTTGPFGGFRRRPLAGPGGNRPGEGPGG